ncbi:hypothetical protein V5799_005811 [Amblyomma americanum]|uniref:Peritrophic membrane chitin binding protein n=1 Tax=Amblyomma americanum TaxID=6943 RepID=A0AAQ4DY71_AMBAM
MRSLQASGPKFWSEIYPDIQAARRCVQVCSRPHSRRTGTPFHGTPSGWCRARGRPRPSRAAYPGAAVSTPATTAGSTASVTTTVPPDLPAETAAPSSPWNAAVASSTRSSLTTSGKPNTTAGNGYDYNPACDQSLYKDKSLFIDNVKITVFRFLPGAAVSTPAKTAGSTASVATSAPPDLSTETAAPSSPWNAAVASSTRSSLATSGKPNATAGNVYDYNTICDQSLYKDKVKFTDLRFLPGAAVSTPATTAGSTTSVATLVPPDIPTETAAASSPWDTAVASSTRSSLTTSGKPNSTAGAAVSTPATTAGSTASVTTTVPPDLPAETAAPSSPCNAAVASSTISSLTTSGKPNATAGNSLYKDKVKITVLRFLPGAAVSTPATTAGSTASVATSVPPDLPTEMVTPSSPWNDAVASSTRSSLTASGKPNATAGNGDDYKPTCDQSLYKDKVKITVLRFLPGAAVSTPATTAGSTASVATSVRPDLPTDTAAPSSPWNAAVASSTRSSLTTSGKPNATAGNVYDYNPTCDHSLFKDKVKITVLRFLPGAAVSTHATTAGSTASVATSVPPDLPTDTAAPSSPWNAAVASSTRSSLTTSGKPNATAGNVYDYNPTCDQSLYKDKVKITVLRFLPGAAVSTPATTAGSTASVATSVPPDLPTEMVTPSSPWNAAVASSTRSSLTASGKPNATAGNGDDYKPTCDQSLYKDKVKITVLRFLPGAAVSTPATTAGSTASVATSVRPDLPTDTAAPSSPWNAAVASSTRSSLTTSGKPNATAGNVYDYNPTCDHSLFIDKVKITVLRFLLGAAVSTHATTAGSTASVATSAPPALPTETGAPSSPGDAAVTSSRTTSASTISGTTFTTPALDLDAGCDDNVCRPPHCACAGDLPPAGLLKDKAPQFVMLMFDGVVNVVNMKFYRELLEGARRKNRANGCGIAATFFVSHEYLDYAAVNELHSWGNEIALHSIRYDCSLVHHRSSDQQPTFPYTMDFGLQRGCNVDPCPRDTYPGFWLLPVNVLFRSNLSCATVDACMPQPTSAKDTFEFLRSNFEEFYASNRAPFPVLLREAYLQHPGREQGYLQFVDWLLQKDDVYLVTASEVLRFMQNPEPLDVYDQLVCPGRRPAVNTCPKPTTCPYKHTQFGSERYMRICSPCPKNYPWVGNPLGN